MRKVSFLLFILLAFSFSPVQHQPGGAWEYRENNLVHTLIMADNYFTIATYDLEGKKFLETYGGTAHFEKGNLSGNIEFNSSNKENVGKPYQYLAWIQGNEMLLTRDSHKELWKRIDDGSGQLVGNWRINRREQNGQMNEMNPGPRKTIKILSSTRFQWAAINIQTGEFFGTGGGKYSFKDGKYTEMIEFFSRDSSRVGMSLIFDARVEGREWFHSGKSSKGEPVNEVWKR
jgi:hypothetical protein